MKKGKNYRSVWSRIAGMVFLLILVVFACLDIDATSYTFSFNFRKLPNCAPFIFLYILLQFWLFPSHIRQRRAGRFFLMSVLTTIAISLLWVFVFLPHFHAHHDLNSKMIFVHWLSCFIICIVVLGFFVTINLPHLTITIEDERQKIESEKAKAELELLKYQLNPHFLMNTLNNIHALIEIDACAAQQSVRMLSKLMRFMYNENSQERIDIQKDMDAMETYFDLMRLRFIDTVDIRFNVPSPMPNVKIPPCIFVNLAENAFKHGVSYHGKSFVYFDLTIDAHWVCGTIRNSLSSQNAHVKSTGFGLDALLNRLEYLYPDRYKYDVQITDNEYIVELKIPVE